MSLDIPKGMNIHSAATYARDYAAKQRANYVTIVFNDINLTVYATSNPDDIALIYYLESEVRRLKR
ncbi:hypothetical protein PMW_183 [Pseudomonas phage phiPMW]|uniref:Uncharacterized protein n=1 Tax=Pseudomonas phage phiPMW TaxID=1815582 RepID=A0A1S5R1Q9_9CAUD|nr:hypothetical protein FDG97_gp167 [Pseudomonas phage phiPMW]ANA49308.1 hypothetical protein PMW_183 [Pseudomonas phage phiPMW]